MDGRQVQRYIFLGLFLFLFVLTAVLFYPFMSILLWSGVLYVITLPIYNRIVKRKRLVQRHPVFRSIVAGVMATLCMIIVVIPTVLIGITVIVQLKEFVQTLSRFLEANRHVFETVKGESIAALIMDQTAGFIDLRNIDIRVELTKLLTSSASSIFSFSSAAFRNLLGFGFSLTFLVFTLFFLYLDGDYLVSTLIDMVPIDRRYTVAFLRRFRDTARHLVRGYLLVALYQGVAAFVIFGIFQVTSPVFLAVLVSLTSFVPMVGTALVWAPVTIGRFISGDFAGGIALGLTCAFFISIVDNFLRPFLLHEKIKIHPLLIFFAILGGIRMFGVNGILIGPIVLILFFAAIELFEEAFGKRKERKVGPYDDPRH
ncbi:MAG: AI-2E family transporter [Spirochaetes bacterium]|nr:AI-2E family transporter [Spirochaetota bacterium]